MKTKRIIHQVITWLIAFVWLANGLFCKLLNLVPRHQEIVGVILGENHKGFFTTLIGIGELFVFIWIISRCKPRACAIFQILLVGIMNLIEFFLVPELLLFGKFNLLVAILFILIIWFHEIARKKYFFAR